MMAETQTKKTSKKTVKTTHWVTDPRHLPIALPRVGPGGPKLPEMPEWLSEAPEGAYFSPILLVRAGFYKNQVSAQVALRKWTERGFLEHPGRGVYQKIVST